MLSEVKSDKDKYYMFLLIRGIQKIKQMNEYTKTEIDSQIQEQTTGYQWGEGSGEGQDRGRGLRDIHYYV